MCSWHRFNVHWPNCCFALSSEPPMCDLKLGPCEGQGKTEQAGQARWAGDRCTEQGNSYVRLALGSAKQRDLCSHLPNLKVSAEALPGLGQAYHPNGLSTITLSQGYFFGAASSMEVPCCWAPAPRSTRSHVLVMAAIQSNSNDSRANRGRCLPSPLQPPLRS